MSGQRVLDGYRGRRAVIVASTGGHLSQAARWFERLELSEESTFVTFKTSQSESLLHNRNVSYLPYVAPRSVKGVAGAASRLLIARSVRSADFVLSTGAGLALAMVIPAALWRKKFVYIESVSRFLGPSLTGRILRRIPWVDVYAQHDGPGYQGWSTVPSLLGDYVVRGEGQAKSESRVFVTLGTIRPYRFDALVDAVQRNLGEGDQAVWQVGVTRRDDLRGDVFEEMSSSDFDKAAKAADIVISHAGVGTLMRLFELGISPIVVARSSSRGEHVDDHQVQVANALSETGLVLKLDPDEFSPGVMRTARPRVGLR